jgi:hypothetical protein
MPLRQCSAVARTLGLGLPYLGLARTWTERAGVAWGRYAVEQTWLALFDIAFCMSVLRKHARDISRSLFQIQKLGGLLKESGSLKVGRLVDEVGKSSGLLRKLGSWELGEPVREVRK